MSRSWIGLDIGGANFKFVCNGESGSIAFPLWSDFDRLPAFLGNFLQEHSTPDVSLAVTMTGELADCFISRPHGVNQIVSMVARLWHGQQLQFYNTCGGWYSPEQAIENWLDVASANWHASASFAGQFLESGNGFLIDVGSTTVDIIPIRDGKPAAIGKTDFDRLANRELLYAGVQRTPVCSLCQKFELDGQSVGAAREFFATIDDALLVTGDPRNSENVPTADGRAATPEFAAQRLSRIVCDDSLRLGQQNVLAIANQVKQALTTALANSIGHVVNTHPDLPKRFLLCGQGEWLAAAILQNHFEFEELVRMSQLTSNAVSTCLAAYSVAQLAAKTGAPDSDCFPVRCKAKQRLPFRVVKIGGSLLGTGSTPEQVTNWIGLQSEMVNVWIVGGGQLVEFVRQFDARSPIDQDEAHWICIDLMSVNTRLVSGWFPGWQLGSSLAEITTVNRPSNFLFDSASWLRAQQTIGRTRIPPASWEVTSDTIAACVARQLDATELVLLKSCPIPENIEIQSLPEKGITDRHFPDFANGIPNVRIVNLNAPDFREVHPGRSSIA